MKLSSQLTLLVVFGVVIVIGLSQFNQPPTEPAKPDTVYMRVMQQAKAVAETTRVSVLKVRTLIDTMPGDTIYIPRVTVETLLVKCERCANQLDSLRLYVDSARKVDGDSIAKLNAKLQACKGSRKWFALGGVVGCAAVRR